MNEMLYIFLAAGVVSMSAALSASALNKLPETERPTWLQSKNAQVSVVLAGNLAALSLVGAMAYGFLTLHWSIPLSCMFVTFPIVHLVLLQRLLGDKLTLMVMLPLTVAADIYLYLNWP